MWFRRVCAVFLAASFTLGLLCLPGIALAERPRPGDEVAAAGGAAECGAACVVGALLVALVSLAIWIVVLVWVARDAKSRGMENAVLWIVLVLLTGLIGLIIYILVRPKGTLVQCAQCQKKRLETSTRCPHCGNA